MYFFLIILFAGAFAETLLKLSAMSRTCRFLTLLSVIATVYFAHPLAAGINMDSFRQVISSPGTLNTACTVIIIQSVLSILFLVSALAPGKTGLKLKLCKSAGLLPSMLFPAGMFTAMVYIFNNIRHAGFETSALFFCLAVFASAFLFSETIALLLSEKKGRIGLTFAFQLLLIFTAMFFPVIIHGKRFRGSFPEVTLSSFILVLAVFFTAAASGFIIHSWRKYGKRLFVRLVRSRRNKIGKLSPAYETEALQ
jgi:hypothetical protein